MSDLIKKEPKGLTEKQQSFLDALFSEQAKGDLRVALKLSGYAENTPVGQVLSSEELAEAVVKRAKDFIAQNSAKASFALLDGIITPAAIGMQNKLKAATEILNRAGVKEQTADIKLEVGQGIVILPAKAGPAEIPELTEGTVIEHQG